MPGGDSAWMRTHGFADWIWDHDLGVHIPCCSFLLLQLARAGNAGLKHCGNGPLVGDEIGRGVCEEHLHMAINGKPHPWQPNTCAACHSMLGFVDGPEPGSVVSHGVSANE